MKFGTRVAIGLVMLSAWGTRCEAALAEETRPTLGVIRAMRVNVRTLAVTPRDLTDAETADFRTLLAQTRTHLGALGEAYAEREAGEAELAEFSRVHLRLSQLAAKSSIGAADLESLRTVEKALRARREEVARSSSD